VKGLFAELKRRNVYKWRWPGRMLQGRVIQVLLVAQFGIINEQ
jgi:hypothetical protein